MSDFYRLQAQASDRTLEIIVPAERMPEGVVELLALAPNALCWSCEPWESPHLPRSA